MLMKSKVVVYTMAGMISIQRKLHFLAGYEKWTVEERGNVLRFITGTSRVPLDGFDPVFTITKASDVGSGALPTAHTCFNQLVLPPYESLEQLVEKMQYALRESKGFHMT